MRLRISLYAVAAMLIAAHFLRAGHIVIALLCLAVPCLFLLRQAWVLPLLQVLAYCAATTWLWTAWELAVVRRSANQPWVLGVTILVAVAALSALSGALLSKNAAGRITNPEPGQQ